MKSHWWFVAAFAAVLGLTCGAVLSAQHGKGHGKDKSAGDQIHAVLPASEPVFTVEEREVITTYFRKGHDGLPPGLAKREHLPPGLEKHLRKQGSLPPGLQKKIQPLPVTLERQLRVLPTGYRRIVVGGNIVLMNEKTGLIYDVVRNLIP